MVTRFNPLARISASAKYSRAYTAVLAVPMALGLGYCVTTAAYNFPPSPLKVRIQPALNTAMEPYFNQSWRLFAPNPPNGNYAGWFQVRYPFEGNTKTSQIFALTQPLIDEAQTHWLFPSRLDRIPISLGYQLSDITTSLDKAPKLGAEATVAEAQLRQQHARVSAELCRLVSIMLPQLLPGEYYGTIEMRVFFTWTPVIRFADRDNRNAPTPLPIRIGDTGWQPSVPMESP